MPQRTRVCSEAPLFAQTLDVAMEGKVVGGDFVGLAILGELDGVRGASGRSGILGYLNNLPAFVDQVPQPLELWMSPQPATETSRQPATYLGGEPYSRAELLSGGALLDVGIV
jgi:hypothetical protein